MAVFGIICETNPMHNGHKYLIDEARNAGADSIVCIMSGNTVQRGEFAITDKYTRAEALIECGADLVVELPFPWCSSSAEYFALAGISIASKLCDTLIFGSECGNIDTLTVAAKASSEEAFRIDYNKKLEEGEQAARIYRTLLEEKIGHTLSSNDLLGIEYIRASIKLGSHMNFVTVSRKGDGYNETEISDKTYPSATALRKMWTEGAFEDSKTYIPDEAYTVYKNAISKNKLTDIKELDSAILAFFRLKNGEELITVAGSESGLANRFCEKAKDARSLDELISLVKTKRYTDSHLRRFLLYCLAGVTEDDIKESPREALLLAANNKGRELLSSKRKSDSFSVITKPADLNGNYRQNILTKRIDMIFTLAHKSKLSGNTYLKNKPYIK